MDEEKKDLVENEEVPQDGESKEKDGGSGMVLGMCLGLAIGTAVGAATGNLGTWMPIGMCLGLALGFSFDAAKKKEKGDPDGKD